MPCPTPPRTPTRFADSHRFVRLATAMLAASLASSALAQPSIDWSTVDCGGGISSAPVPGGTISIRSTIRQHDAGAATGTGIGILSGFWAAGTIPSACPADLDNGSGTGTTDNAVTIDDLLYFLVGFEAGTVNVDLDNDGDPTVGAPEGAVTIDDLLFFLIRFEGGC